MGSCYCVESSVVGCLLCHAGCSTDKLASSLAFHPPSPPSYALTTAPDGRRRAVFDPANEEYSRLARDWGAALAQCEVDEVRTRRGNTVCVLRLRRGSADDAYVGRVTLIVSHGNALAKWEAQKREWERIKRERAIAFNKRPGDLVMERCDEHRRKLEILGPRHGGADIGARGGRAVAVEDVASR